MIKLTGCIILFACCSMLGYIKASSYKSRTIELENAIEMIKLMDMQMTYKKDPLSRIFQTIGDAKNSWTSEVFVACSLRLSDHMSLGDAWNESLKENKHNCPLEKHDLDILGDFISGLGKSDSEGQRKIIEPAQIRLQTALKTSIDRENKLGRMYKALGTAAGAVAVIMLI